MLKFIGITAVVLVGFFVLFLVLAPPANQAPVNQTTNTNPRDRVSLEQRADMENRPALIIGDPEAPVTLVEYGDFKCPSCNQFHHGVGQQLREEYVMSGRANIEFRNYPFIGPDSGSEARATYCAYVQGVFSEYHDKVYEFLWDTYYTQGDLNAEFRDVLTFDKLEEIMANDLDDAELFAECIRSNENNRFV